MTNDFSFDLTAAWLCPIDSNFDDKDRRIHFRRSFELNTLPNDPVEILITADSRYTLWINGQYVHHGPARGFQDSYPFDRIDIRSFLRPGKNVIAVLLYQYGLSNFSYKYMSRTGFLLSCKIADISYSSNENWRWREAPGYFRNIARGAIQYCFQEFFDCRTGDDNWLAINYDDSKWQMNCPSAPQGSAPWHTLEDRSIPLFRRKKISPKKIIAQAQGIATHNWEKIEDIRKTLKNEAFKWENKEEKVDTLQLLPGINGKIFDWEQEAVGILFFEIESSSADEVLTIFVFESMLDGKPNVSDDPVTLFGGKIILKKGKNKHFFTMPLGFRYLAICSSGKADIKINVSLQETLYPLEIRGRFNCSDAVLQKIWDISVHTQQSCMSDAYIDCPWREYVQWWGDALVQSSNTFRLTDDSRLMARGLRQIGKKTLPNGLTYAIAPSSELMVLPDYSAVWIVTLLQYYWQTGSLDLWLELRKTADRIMDYFEAQLEVDGLLHYDPRYWLFCDWSPTLHKKGIPSLYNLFVLWAMKSGKELSALSADKKHLDRFSSLADKLEKSITERLYQADTGILAEGFSEEGELILEMSPHSAAIAILLDLFSESHAKWIKDIILPILKNRHTAAVQPSPYFMYYIFEALKKKEAYNKEIVDCIKLYWGEFLAADCVTTPENWLEIVINGEWSRCHAWSAHPIYNFSAILLGVKQLKPGWQEVAFSPYMIKGEKVSGVVPTPFGDIEVSWDWTKETPEKKINLPEGITLK